MRRCTAKAQIFSECRIHYSSQPAYFDAVALGVIRSVMSPNHGGPRMLARTRYKFSYSLNHSLDVVWRTGECPRVVSSIVANASPSGYELAVGLRINGGRPVVSSLRYGGVVLTDGTIACDNQSVFGYKM